MIPQPDLVGNVSRIVQFMHLKLIKCNLSDNSKSALLLFTPMNISEMH